MGRYTRITIEAAPSATAGRAELTGLETSFTGQFDLLDRMAEAVSIIGADGVHLHVNAAATAILADLRARHEGRALADVSWGSVDAGGEPLANENLPAEVTRLTGKACTEVEIGFPGASGDVRWLRISSRRLSEEGPPYPCLISFADVTDARRTKAELQEAETQARTDRARLQSILDHLPLGIYLRGLDDRYQIVNAHFASEFGRPAGEIIGRTARELHPETLVDWARDFERPIRERGESVSGESTAPHPDGTDHYHWIIKYPVTDERGDLIAIGGAILDITERRRTELALAEAEAEQAALRRVATAVTQDVGAAAVFDLVAEELTRLLGLDMGVVTRFESDDEALVVGSWSADPAATLTGTIKLDGTNATSTVARTGRAARIDQYEATAFSGGATASVAAPITIAGRRWGAVGAARMGEGTVPAKAEERAAHFADLAATAIGNAEAWQTLARQAATDALTGLANYRSFHDRLTVEAERAQRYGRELSLVLLDVDAFKSINDRHGHSTGDSVLADVARRLSAQARASDLVARVGGEEFACLLPETAATDAYEVTERVRRSIEREPFQVAGRVTISAGVCALGESGDAQRLLQFADTAMYWAKQGGRNATVHYTEAERRRRSLTDPEASQRTASRRGRRASR